MLSLGFVSVLVVPDFLPRHAMMSLSRSHFFLYLLWPLDRLVQYLSVIILCHCHINVGLYEEYETENGSSGHENGSEAVGSLVADRQPLQKLNEESEMM